MARVSTYLNFPGTCSEAFAFYRDVFGTEYTGPIQHMRDVPAAPDQSPVAASELDAVMHVELPILAGHVLMGTDMLESLGHVCRVGNNTTINLEFDDEAELRRVFRLLAEGADDAMEPASMFWGAIWGTCLDRFGIRWMVNCPAAAA